MKITVLGGGNIGTALAGELSLVESVSVTLCTSKATIFSVPIRIFDDEKHTDYLSGFFQVTSDQTQAVSDADLIFITYPAFMRGHVANKIIPKLKKEAMVGLIPGYGCGEVICNTAAAERTVFALQKVPFIARIVENGKSCRILSRKKILYLATLPRANGSRVCNLVEELLNINTHQLHSFLSVDLFPGNPLLHTSGTYYYLRNYQRGDYLPNPIYYYREWNDACSKVLLEFSNEMMHVCANFPLDLSEIQSIQEYYESGTPEKLTAKLKSIPSFHDIQLPMKKIEGHGYIPDFQSRFFTEDFPFGVCVIKGMALLTGVETPVIDEMLDWYQHLAGKEYFSKDAPGKDIKETGAVQAFGISSIAETVEKYSM